MAHLILRLSSNAFIDGARGTAGAGASLTNAVSGSTTGSLTFIQSATGGAGGEGLCSSGCGEGNAGGNASSTLIVNDKSAGSLSGTVNATGGSGGNTFYGPSIGGHPQGGAGGNAIADIALTSARSGVSVSATANAAGGAGGVGVPYAPFTSGLAPNPVLPGAPAPRMQRRTPRPQKARWLKRNRPRSDRADRRSRPL